MDLTKLSKAVDKKLKRLMMDVVDKQQIAGQMVEVFTTVDGKFFAAVENFWIGNRHPTIGECIAEARRELPKENKKYGKVK